MMHNIAVPNPAEILKLTFFDLAIVCLYNTDTCSVINMVLTFLMIKVRQHNKMTNDLVFTVINAQSKSCSELTL